MESKLNAEEILLLANQVIGRESSAVGAIISQLDQHFIEATQILMDCQGHVLVAGAGTSHAVALRLAHLLSCCGTPSLFLDPGDAQHGLSGAVTARDVLIVISKGGTTSEINQLVRIAKIRGARVIAITENPDSPMGQMCDLNLKIVAPEGVDMYGMIATGSSLVNSAFADALCIVMATLRNYSQDQFGLTHPGGAVGEKLKQA
jgi:D-arabinose 5-phosphate isomerase GutQ